MNTFKPVLSNRWNSLFVLTALLTLLSVSQASEQRQIGDMQAMESAQLEDSVVSMAARSDDMLEEQETWLKEQQWLLSQPSASAPDTRDVPLQYAPIRQPSTLTPVQEHFRDHLINMFSDQARQAYQ